MKRTRHRYMTDEQRLLDGRDISGGLGACWPWKGKLDRDGYGFLRVRGRDARAHRFAYEVERGAMPVGACVLHTCDNPPCCNPAHLYAGTRTQNNADKIARGRNPRGEGWYAPRLNDQAVRVARWFAARKVPISRIAQAFGVSKSAVGAAVVGRTWGHVHTPSPVTGRTY